MGIQLEEWLTSSERLWNKTTKDDMKVKVYGCEIVEKLEATSNKRPKRCSKSSDWIVKVNHNFNKVYHKVQAWRVKFDKYVFDTHKRYRDEDNWVRDKNGRKCAEPLLGIATYNIHRNLQSQLEKERKIIKIRQAHYKAVALEARFSCSTRIT